MPLNISKDEADAEQRREPPDVDVSPVDWGDNVVHADEESSGAWIMDKSGLTVDLHGWR